MPANPLSHASKPNIPNGQAHNPSGASPQPLGSLLTEGVEQAAMSSLTEQQPTS